ncbi:MAG TPA: hypothetical protein O0W87_03400 [Methanocorpusculum sp.]|nr:hypothetical protein [Methanocorpusculum sp.]HJJ50601.1 hypothetical protein [Methanocorpusculum sp.]
MKRIILAGLACITLLVVCTAGCIDIGSDDIVGSWYSEDEYFTSGTYYDTKYIFNSDGTGTEYWYISSTGELDEAYGFNWKNEGNGVYMTKYIDYSSDYDEPFYLRGSSLYDDYDIKYYKK